MSDKEETHYEVVRIKKHSMYEMLKIGLFLCVVVIGGNMFTGANMNLNEFISKSIGICQSAVAFCANCLQAI